MGTNSILFFQLKEESTVDELCAALLGAYFSKCVVYSPNHEPAILSYINSIYKGSLLVNIETDINPAAFTNSNAIMVGESRASSDPSNKLKGIEYHYLNNTSISLKEVPSVLDLEAQDVSLSALIYNNFYRDLETKYIKELADVLHLAYIGTLDAINRNNGFLSPSTIKFNSYVETKLTQIGEPVFTHFFKNRIHYTEYLRTLTDLKKVEVIDGSIFICNTETEDRTALLNMLNYMLIDNIETAIILSCNKTIAVMSTTRSLTNDDVYDTLCDIPPISKHNYQDASFYELPKPLLELDSSRLLHLHEENRELVGDFGNTDEHVQMQYKNMCIRFIDLNQYLSHDDYININGDYVCCSGILLLEDLTLLPINETELNRNFRLAPEGIPADCDSALGECSQYPRIILPNGTVLTIDYDNRDLHWVYITERYPEKLNLLKCECNTKCMSIYNNKINARKGDYLIVGKNSVDFTYISKELMPKILIPYKQEATR